MSDCQKCRDMFVEVLYDDLDPENKLIFDSHLQKCEKCASEFSEMETTVKFMDKKARPQMERDFWDGYWDRLAEKKRNEKHSISGFAERRKSLIRLVNLTPRWAYQAAAALVLVVLGIFIGREFFSPAGVTIRQETNIAASDTQTQGIEFVSRARNYFERSKLVLLPLVNFDPETEDPYALNLPLQKQISRDLVSEAKVIKAGLADFRQRRLQELVADLEVILIQIANLETEHDLSAIEFVKHGVESRGILLKINLTEMRQETGRSKKPGRVSTSKKNINKL